MLPKRVVYWVWLTRESSVFSPGATAALTPPSKPWMLELEVAMWLNHRSSTRSRGSKEKSPLKKELQEGVGGYDTAVVMMEERKESETARKIELVRKRQRNSCGRLVRANPKTYRKVTLMVTSWSPLKPEIRVRKEISPLICVSRTPQFIISSTWSQSQDDDGPVMALARPLPSPFIPPPNTGLLRARRHAILVLLIVGIRYYRWNRWTRSYFSPKMEAHKGLDVGMAVVIRSNEMVVGDQR
ncbi:uncharacterized protein BT62DRAFT_1012923 [Guyanagaster necrorhizus]|uniref:Uncharacterized protein n=1 Tax=Guyanagaster necrorhizus TaxID=856835 RepID=A0A9P7VHY5_9AGAR|nr:uncharacterized protein BT62DRAFT_1012923 [Guyanagaster necrorhizus MCA 3950]KAG7440264.1 hypothetical protein BT62DRAFT_1012923 [Guyanagaster necrorhizus MCA 3950]